MTSARTTHYTAVIEVNRVREATEAEIDQYGKTRTPAQPKEVGEISRLVLRSGTLQGLKDKIAAHVALLEED